MCLWHKQNFAGIHGLFPDTHLFVDIHNKPAYKMISLNSFANSGGGLPRLQSS
jgi:hypothetical protein